MRSCRFERLRGPVALPGVNRGLVARSLPGSEQVGLSFKRLEILEFAIRRAKEKPTHRRVFYNFFEKKINSLALPLVS